MMNKSIILLLSFIIIQVSKAQIIKINLDSLAEDDKFKKSQAIIPVYKYTGLDVEPFTKFGVEQKETEAKIIIKTLPNMSRCKDTAFTFIYFSGIKNNTDGYLLTLIGNYKRTRNTIYFFIDRNNNLDFTDDGKPDSIIYMETNKIITFKNEINSNSEYNVKLSRVEYGKNQGYKNLLQEHYKKHSGTKIFTDVHYCYREQRLNVKSAIYKSENDSFKIALKDVNINGLYDDEGVDKIYIGTAKDIILADDFEVIKKDIKNHQIEWNFKTYSINKIDEAGTFIEIKSEPQKTVKNKLRVKRKVPKFNFNDEMGNTISIKSYKKHQIYLYFWDNKIPSLNEDTTYLRKIHNEFGSKIKIIGLNYGQKPKHMRNFKEYGHIDWTVGLSNLKINKKYYVKSLPKGVYIGKRLKLKKESISPKDLYILLLEKK